MSFIAKESITIWQSINLIFGYLFHNSLVKLKCPLLHQLFCDYFAIIYAELIIVYDSGIYCSFYQLFSLFICHFLLGFCTALKSFNLSNTFACI